MLDERQFSNLSYLCRAVKILREGAFSLLFQEGRLCKVSKEIRFFAVGKDADPTNLLYFVGLRPVGRRIGQRGMVKKGSH